MAKNPNWSALEDTQILEFYSRLGAQATAAQLPGRTRGAVWRRANLLGLPGPKRTNAKHRKLTEEQKVELIRLYESAEQPSVKAICATLDLKVGLGCVYDALKAAGVARSKTGQRCRKWTAAMGVECIAAYEDGATQPELAKRYGCLPGQISAVLKRQGVVCRLQKRIFTADETTEIVRRYKAGDAADEIAAAFDVYHKRILSIVRAAGVTLRPPRRYPWIDRRGRHAAFRSSWELVVAQHLDAAGLTWTYEEHCYTVCVEGVSGRYTPDFHVYDVDGKLTTIIEVKGWTHGDPHTQAARRDGLRLMLPGVAIEVWNAAVMAQKGLLQQVSALYPSTIARNNGRTGP